MDNFLIFSILLLSQELKVIDKFILLLLMYLKEIEFLYSD